MAFVGESEVRVFFFLTRFVRAAHQPGVVIPGIVFGGSLETPPGLVDALVSLIQKPESDPRRDVLRVHAYGPVKQGQRLPKQGKQETRA